MTDGEKNMGNDKRGLIPQKTESKALKISVKAMSLDPVRYDDPVELENRIQLYFSQCDENKLFPSVTGLSLFLGIDRSTLWKWKTAKRRENDQRYIEIIQRAYDVIEESMIQEMLSGGVKNPISAIFYLKNLHGYTDGIESNRKDSEEMSDDRKMAEISERYNIVDAEIIDNNEDG